jgi:hypothetical protein
VRAVPAERWATRPGDPQISVFSVMAHELGHTHHLNTNLQDTITGIISGTGLEPYANGRALQELLESEDVDFETAYRTVCVLVRECNVPIHEDMAICGGDKLCDPTEKYTK